MRYIIFAILAFVEFVFMTMLTKELDHIKEYISIQYSSFEFSSREDKPTGLNTLIKVLVPVIYIIIIAGILYEVNLEWLISDIYLVTIIYYFIKWLNILFLLKRKDLHDWKTDVILAVISTILSVTIYYTFIIKTKQIFASVEEIRDGVWVSIIIFIFVVIRDNIYNNVKTKHIEEEKRKYKYIRKKYLYFKDKYELQDVLIAKESHKLFKDALTALRKKNITDLSDQVIFIIDSVLNKLTKNPTLLKFISKNLSWGIYSKTIRKVYEDSGEDEDGIYKLFLKGVKENNIPLKNPDVTLFMIIELVSSTCFNSILYGEPLPIDEYKPILYDTIKKLINNN